MGEKKIVVDGIRFTYSGMFDIHDFFDELEKWADAHGFERETKKKLEHVHEGHKAMEYIFEFFHQMTDYSRSVVRLRAIFNDVVEFPLQRNEHIRIMQKGKVLILVDGFLEEDTEGRWVVKPAFVFLRTIYEKLIHKYWTDSHDSHVRDPSYDLLNHLHAFFKRYSS